MYTYIGGELRKYSLEEKRPYSDSNLKTDRYFVLKATEYQNGFTENYVYGHKNTQFEKTGIFGYKELHCFDDTKNIETFIKFLPKGVEATYSYRRVKTKSSNKRYYNENYDIEIHIEVSKSWCQNICANAKKFADKLLNEHKDLLDEFLKHFALSTLMEIDEICIKEYSGGQYVHYEEYNMKKLDDIVKVYGMAIALAKRIEELGGEAKVTTDYQHVYIEKKSSKTLKEW